MISIKRLCRRSIYFLILFLIIFTIISIYYYHKYLLHRQSQLNKLITSLKNIPSNNITSHQEFQSTILPLYLTKSIQTYLSTQHNQYLIINCQTGLGNRLQSIISAFLLAFLTNRRLLIHWSVTGLSSCEYHDLFQPILPMSSILLNNYTEEYIIKNSDHLTFHGPFDELLCYRNLTLYKQNIQFLFLSTDEYFLSVLIKNPSYSQTLFKNLNEDLLFKTLINYLFIPTKELNDKIQFYYDSNNSNKYCHKGIHMRKDGLKQIKTNGEKVFLDCILNKTISTNETWFIASDYNPFKSYIKSHKPSPNINIWALNSSGDSSKCLDVQQAIIELWLLSKCKQLFLTHWSSFSWLISGMSGTYPFIVTNDSCHIQPFSRPCYYELTHIQQLSCYNYNQMLKNDHCCQSEKFCDENCLHHDSKYGAHQVYFLVIWPILPLCQWLFKWIMISFLLIFLFNRIKLRWDFIKLIDLYKKLLIVIMFLCVLFVNIRCLFWYKRKIL